MARDTIVDRFFAKAETAANTPALHYDDGGVWRSYTWAEYADKVRHFAGALIAMGFEEGDAIVIMGNNCPEWLIADIGAMVARGTPAGIHQAANAEQSLYIANHSESKVFVIENKEVFDHISMSENRDKLETVEKIVLMYEADQIDHPDVVGFEEFLESGAAHLDAVEERVSKIELDDRGTMIYTSGTTGPPKAVMLSHENLAWTAKNAIEAVGGVSAKDTVVSYLPLMHIAEQMFSIHLAITAGYPIFFCNDLKKVKDTLVVARPTLFLAVPRVWEKFKAALESRLAEATGLKASIVSWSRQVGLEAGQIIIDKGVEGLPFGLKVKYDIANKLFFSKLKAGLGLDRLEIAVTGAAPIGMDVLEFFMSVGIIIHEVYGQSEGSGPSTFNQPNPGMRRLGSAGQPFPGCEIKIAEDGEILVKGKNVFQGYFKNPEATAETLQDGWLYSGDIGRFDDDGFLYITDRKKDLIITAGGKNIAPQKIEKLLRKIDGVSQAVVIGDRRKFLSALLTIDPERGPDLAADHGWPTDTSELAENEDFHKYVEDGVEKANSELARYETIKKFTILPNDFTPETGELTPTLKVKRRIVNEKHGDKIEAFYAGLD